MSQLDSERIKKGLSRIWMVWGALLYSLFVYVMLCHMLDSSWEPILDSSSPSDTLRILLYIVSAVLLVTSHYFRNYILTSKDPKTNAAYIERASKANTNPAIVRYSTAVICSTTTGTSVGVAGLGMFLLTEDFQTLYLLVAISAIAVVYHRPKKSEFESLVSSLNGTKTQPSPKG